MKKILFLLLLISALHFQTASAHSKLVSSTPEDGAVLKEPLKEISLTFNTAVEPSSTFKLMQGSKEIPLSEVEADGKTLSAKVPDALENGAYTVSWDIVGADGHQIQGKLDFTEEAAAPAKKEEPAKKAEPAKKEEPKQTEPKKEEKTESAKGAAGISPAAAAAIAILAAAAVIILLLLLRKGRK
ncbi:copper resistance protein CopC [Metabacillus sp. GX 13764]|uniref:copper resistance CopC family protein n=1 Tax=Metabacillus kandeliae TaxID=2900151 RepID=UPI001E355D2C|nr:copper resistance CopC family protein [Metabacillus kandeliae]MCD7036330.1 copper resistance protein CopC [Metabacillus kandeliae]